MHKFLLRTNTIDEMDAVLAASNYASFENRDEEQVSVTCRYPVTINGIDVSNQHTFTFLASTLKGLTLPHTQTVNIPIEFNGVSINRDLDFVVDNLQPFKRDRENWLSFTVNGERYQVPDNGGKVLVPAEGVRLYDFGANGWPLVNIKAVYAPDGTQTTAPSVIPGVFVVMSFQGAMYDNDVRANPADDSLWERSVLANSFKTQGTERTYTRTAAQTDWGEGYSLTYYERTVGGAVVGMVNPADFPAEILAQHGVLR